MKTHDYRTILAALAFIGSGGMALAQSLPASPGRDLSIGTSTFNVRTMDFDLWCQQTQRYAADRCAARRAEDVKAFEDYRGSIERYELDYLKQVQKEQEVRTRTNREPDCDRKTGRRPLITLWKRRFSERSDIRAAAFQLRDKAHEIVDDSAGIDAERIIVRVHAHARADKAQMRRTRMGPPAIMSRWGRRRGWRIYRSGILLPHEF